jgi:hypothetical protein
MADWATISSLATAGGTLVLAIATFSAVRTSHRATRATERALQVSLRPVLLPARFEDPPAKVMFLDDHWLKVEGGRFGIDVTDEVIYMVLPLRNVGQGLAVLDRWDIRPGRLRGDVEPNDLSVYRRLSRDLYVAGGDLGFWQGALRDPDDPLFAEIREQACGEGHLTLDLLYGDHEGGQRTITRFGLNRSAETGVWFAAGSRYWYLEGNDPR